MNESITVRSEERGIYTPSENLTIQIYVGSSDADLRTSDVNRKHCSHRVRSPHEEINVGTLDKHWDFRRSGLPTYIGTSDVRSQSASRTTGVGTPGLGQDFRPSGVSTYVMTSDTDSHRKIIYVLVEC